MKKMKIANIVINAKIKKKGVWVLKTYYHFRGKTLLIFALERLEENGNKFFHHHDFHR